jgi:hypothetical protein
MRELGMTTGARHRRFSTGGLWLMLIVLVALTRNFMRDIMILGPRGRIVEP